MNDSFGGGAPIELIKVAQRRDFAVQPEEVRQALNNWLMHEPSRSPFVVPNSIGAGKISVTRRSLGHQDHIGVLLAGSARADFPTTTERLVLDVAVNQAVIGLQEARRLIEQKQIALELDHRVAERTREVVEREARIRRLVDANIVGIFIWNLEGQILEAIDAFLRMMGYGRDDLVAHCLRWTELTPAEWRERDERALAELKATGTVQPYEKEYFRRDGSRVPVLVGAALFQGSGNEGVAFVLDLSEQKRAEKALRISEAYLAEAQKLSHTGSWAWSPDTDVRYWSEECYRVLGFDPRDSSPRMEEFIQRIHPDDQPAFRESAKRAKHNNLDKELVYRIVHLGGTVRDIHSIGHPIFSPIGFSVYGQHRAVDVQTA